MKAFGNKSTAAQILKVDRNTLYAWTIWGKRKKYWEQIFIEAKDARADFYENKLDLEAARGNMTAVIFGLKSFAKDRGYGDVVNPNIKVQIEGFEGILERPKDDSNNNGH